MRNCVRTSKFALILVLVTWCMAVAGADGDLPDPPYQIHTEEYMAVRVIWNESIRKLLPEGIKPVAGLNGGISIYKSDHGYGLSPYDATYMYIEIEGYDSPTGTKGRWMLQGGYGPEEKLSAKLRAVYGLPVRPATILMTHDANGMYGRAKVAGQDAIEIKFVAGKKECKRIAGITNFVGSVAGKFLVNEVIFGGEWCPQDGGSVKVLATGDDPIAALVPDKAVVFGLIRGNSFAFSRPRAY
jgi:hypothetical protein